jgi:hypothetical protein
MTLRWRCGASGPAVQAAASRRASRAPRAPRWRCRQPVAGSPVPTWAHSGGEGRGREANGPEMARPPGALRSKPSNTARGTPWDSADLRLRPCEARTARSRADFGKPRCREAPRPAGPFGPSASRAPSVLYEDGGEEVGLRLAPGRSKNRSDGACAKRISTVRPRESGDPGLQATTSRKERTGFPLEPVPAQAGTGMNGGESVEQSQFQLLFREGGAV